jgi:hypothetical protein
MLHVVVVKYNETGCPLRRAAVNREVIRLRLGCEAAMNP